MNIQHPNLTAAPSDVYHSITKRKATRSGQPAFCQFDVIAVVVRAKLAAIFFILLSLDDRQNKLNDTDYEPCDPDNNRNHCQSVQAFSSSHIKIWQKTKPTAPFWVAMFVSKLLSLTYNHHNCRKHLKSQELFSNFFLCFLRIINEPRKFDVFRACSNP